MPNFHDTIIAIQAVFSKSSLKSVLSNFTALGAFGVVAYIKSFAFTIG